MKKKILSVLLCVIGITVSGCSSSPKVTGDPLQDAKMLKAIYQRGGDAEGYSRYVRQVYEQRYGKWKGDLKWQDMEQYIYLNNQGDIKL